MSGGCAGVIYAEKQELESPRAPGLRYGSQEVSVWEAMESLHWKGWLRLSVCAPSTYVLDWRSQPVPWESGVLE